MGLATAESLYLDLEVGGREKEEDTKNGVFRDLKASPLVKHFFQQGHMLPNETLALIYLIYCLP